ncbi:MAG: AAA family ATPase [Candidatus Diapherotrites archaeon]|nr:AAA family ATPase [Candidatus Diapherotrites archaeon]
MHKSAFSIEDACIIKDERFLYPDYVPERLPFRDAQIEEIVSSLRPLLRNGKPQNLFIFGPTGTGKTVTAKYVIKELESASSRAKGLYINCFEDHTRNAVLNKLCISLGNAVPRRGLAADELYNELLQTLKTKKISPVIVFDEVDQLIKDKTSSMLLYDLLRANEQHGLQIGLVLVSNLYEILSFLDGRVLSSLSAKNVKFESYTPEQLKQILNDRAKIAFFNNSLDQDAINLAAAYGAKCNGDARVAIEILLSAARMAENEGAKSVNINHIKNAFKTISPRALQKAAPFLDVHEKELLKILCEKDALFSGELYKLYAAKFSSPLTERSFRDKLNRLAELKLISLKDVKEGMRGRTREITLAQPKNAIMRQIIE